MVQNTTPDLAATTRRLVFSQVAFFVLLGACMLVNHSPQAENDGISFYGVDHETILLIALAYVAGFWGLWGAANQLRVLGAPPGLSQGVKAVAVMLFVILATPYTAGTLMNWTHMTTGVVMALIQLAIALSLLSQDRGATAAIGFSVQLAGGILAALSLPDWHFAYLLQGETTFQLGFAVVMVQWLRVIAPLASRSAQSAERTIE